MAQYFIVASRRVDSVERLAFLRNFVADRMRIVYRKYLLVMDDKTFAQSGFEMVDVRLMRLMAQCGIEKFNVPVNNLLRLKKLRSVSYYQMQSLTHNKHINRIKDNLIAHNPDSNT